LPALLFNITVTVFLIFCRQTNRQTSQLFYYTLFLRGVQKGSRLDAVMTVEAELSSNDGSELSRYEQKHNMSQEYLTAAKQAMQEAQFHDAIAILTDALGTCRARSIQVSV